MKKLLFTLLFIATATFTSCGSDDDARSFDNTINVDGDSVEITSASIEDYSDEIISGFYNYDFALIGTSGNDEYELYLELFSPLVEGETPAFRTGTFTYNTSPGDDDFYFNDASIEINDNERQATAGTVTVTGSGTDFNVEASLTLSDGTLMTAEYDGTFIISQG